MNMIVAADKNWAIGKDNSLLVVIPADQKTFRNMTLGHPVVMGRKTFESLPGGLPLDLRKNIVLTTNPDLFCGEAAEHCEGLFLTDSLVSKELGELRMERNGLSVDQGILVLVCFSEGDQLLVVAENGRGIFFFGLYIDGGIAGIQFHPGSAGGEACILSGSPL